jgi:sugar phosphate isomerase/epimerase
MKPTFITDEATQDTGEFVALAKRYAVDAVELRSVEGRAVYRDDLDEVRRLRRRLDAESLRVCALDTPVFKADLAADLGEEIRKLRGALERALILGAPLVRIFTFWKPAGAQPDAGPVVERALERAHEVVHGSGIRLVIENGKRTNHRTGAELAALLADRCAECFGALWDPGNSLLGGTDPDPVENGYPAVLPFLRHVHLKDPRVRADGSREYVELGTGDLRVRDQLAGLARDRYAGYVSLETHWRPAAPLSAELMDVPYGAAFSANGFEATERSLRTLLGWLEAVPVA